LNSTSGPGFGEAAMDGSEGDDGEEGTDAAGLLHPNTPCATSNTPAIPEIDFLDIVLSSG
jgi:hypothetical protein